MHRAESQHALVTFVEYRDFDCSEKDAAQKELCEPIAAWIQTGAACPAK